MARTGNDSGSAGVGNSQETKFQANGQERIELPSSDFIADAKMTRDGDDLVLQAPNGETVTIQGYFSADPVPVLHSADGATLTPNLVDAFVRSPMEFAANDTATDESPVGAVEEVKGNATVTRADGTIETITIGTPIYQGDIIETDASGAVNIVFMDETSMAVSENARLAIDEYKYDPATESGTTNFSVLRGLFVFTSGLIGRDDPDDVSINTPVGSIGIRGTVIAGEINPSGESKITVLEGAIVVKNGLMETVLSEQFQTVTLDGFDAPMRDIGILPANDINTRFNSIGNVNPGLFSMINDAVKEQSLQPHSPQETGPADQSSANETAPKQDTATQENPTATSQSSAPLPLPIADDIVTLSGDTSALPSIQTATGQPSGGLADTAISAPSVSTAGTATNSTSSGSYAGAATGGTTASETAAEPAVQNNTVADTTQQLAPPAVVNNGSTSSQSPATPANPVTPVTPSAFSFAAAVTNDISGEHHVVGNITGPAGVTITSYTITSSNAAWFTVVMSGNNATIELTQAGADFLGSSFDVQQFGNIVVNGLTSDGQTITQTITAAVTDASIGGNLNLNAATPALAAIISDTRNDMLGYSISAIGDTNGDGYVDFLVGKNTTDTTQNISFVVRGDDVPLTSSAFVGISSSSFSNRTEAAGFHAGTVVSGIGDFNGDGVKDFLIGQPGNRIGAIETGTAAVISGANPSNFLAPTAGAGLAAGDLYGQSVTGVADFNNDGYADIVVGSPGANQAHFIAGRTTSWTGNLMTGSESFSNAGSVAFGTSVTGLGDFNGDGYSDVAVGDSAVGANDGFAVIKFGNGGSSPMSTAVQRTLYGDTGQVSGLGHEVTSVGDVNGDGLTDLMIGGNGNFGRIYFGNTGGNFASHISLDIPNTYTLSGGAGVGDFNGDGYDDFVLTFGDAGSTKAYVVYGKSSLTDIDISYLKNPDNAFEISYAGANGSQDIEVSGIGDINGDGYDDFAMGLPDANGASTGNGGFAVIYGRDTGNVDLTGAAVMNAANDGDAIVGSNGTDVILDNGHVGVSMRGGAEADRFEITNTNFLKIDGGSNLPGSRDFIHIVGDLDFSDVDFERISGIEMLEFDDSNQTITLTAENLFNLLKSSDDGTLRIGVGGAGTNNQTLIFNDGNGTDNYNTTEIADVVNFLNAATGGSTVVGASTSGGMDVFQIGGYTLMIDQSITIDAQ